MSWTLKLSEEGKTLYRKEILRTGDFKKAADGIEFTITDGFLDQLELSHRERIDDGIKCPVPMGHSEEEGNNKGWMVGTEREGESLYGLFDINGMTPEDLQNYDVSVYIPPSHVAGNGKKYHRPIRHVALTSCPVIPGLDRFEAIAASLNSPKEEKPMAVDFAKLGTDLGIEELSEENAPELLLSSWKALQAEVEEAKKVTPPSTPEELSALATKHPKLIKHAKSGREARIDALTLGEKPKINKAVRDELVTLFCSDDAVTLSLDETSTADADFDKLVEILGKNELVVSGSVTNPQSLSLSDPLKQEDADQFPLRTDVDNRRKAAGLS
jgi:hypothetical protein